MKMDVIGGKENGLNGFHSSGFLESCRKEVASSESMSVSISSGASRSSTCCLSLELFVGSILPGPSSASW